MNDFPFDTWLPTINFSVPEGTVIDVKVKEGKRYPDVMVMGNQVYNYDECLREKAFDQKEGGPLPLCSVGEVTHWLLVA